MDESKNLAKVTLVAEIIFMVMLSVSFLIMPFANKMSLNEGKNTLLYFSGAMFWASLVFEAVFLIANGAICKKRIMPENKSRPGALRFFTNTTAKIIDILAILSIIGFVICAFLTDKYVTYGFLSAMLLLVQLHCVVNGKNFEYINSLS